MPSRPFAANAPQLQLDAFLPYRLAVLAQSVSRAFSVVYADRFGLSIAEWRVLANLGAAGALTAGEIATHSSLDKPKVTRALQRLKARGLILRVSGKDDRREAYIRLSAAGQRRFHAIAALALDWEQQLLSVLTPAQSHALDGILAALGHQAMALSGGEVRTRDG
jgi:DNA-binding MarR family transcriptional regulator